MSVWGGLIARDMMDAAAEGGREADDLAQVVVEGGVVSWSPWGRHLVVGAWLPPGVAALPELVIL